MRLLSILLWVLLGIALALEGVFLLSAYGSGQARSISQVELRESMLRNHSHSQASDNITRILIPVPEVLVGSHGIAVFALLSVFLGAVAVAVELKTKNKRTKL